MAKESEHVYAEQIFSVVILKNLEDGFKVIDKTELSYLPVIGSYYIIVGGKESLLIEAIIHDDMETYIVVNDSNKKYNAIAEERYGRN